jgi:hypothetical protein
MTMTTLYDYWVTFRIKEDATGDRRRAAMVDRAKKINMGRWMEPTSFMLLECNVLASALAKYLAQPLLADRDLLTVADIRQPTDAAYFGVVQHLGVLKSFLPSITKIG